MAVGALLLTIATVAWLYFLWSRRRFYMCALKMKGDWGYPFIGILHKLYKLEDFLHILPKNPKESKQKTCFTWFGPIPAIYTIDPNVAELVLQSPDCLFKPTVYTAFDDAIGNGLLTSNPPKWTKHRKLLNPSFGYKVLTGMMPTFNNFARDLCEQLDKGVGFGDVDIKELALKIALKASFATVGGIHIEEDINSKILASLDRMLVSITSRVLRPWLRNTTVYSWSSGYKPFLSARNFISNFIQDLVKSKLKVLEKTTTDSDTDQGKRKSSSFVFIDQVIRIHKQNMFTINEAVDETTVMMFAGYETTANTIYTTLMFLAMNPQCQERVFEEISTLFHEKEFNVTSEDFKNLVYLEMCINETLRLTPPVPLIARVCARDLRISEDITIPAGVEMYIDIFNIHRDEDIWGSTAKTYNPDHFLPSNLESKHKCAFLPFSKGKRSCLGWQYAGMFVKVMLAHILRKYKFSTTLRFEDLKYVQYVSMKYTSTPCLEVERR